MLKLAPGLRLNTNQSSNSFGYNQGSLEQGASCSTRLRGLDRPGAEPAHRCQDEASSDWIGIGGGCVDASFTTSDSTLIQTGTEQDAASNGTESISAWYELVPAPSIQITNMTVSPGDHMHASLTEAVADSDVWTIAIKDLTTGQSFTTTVPYPSTHDTTAGFAALPNLTNPNFDLATVERLVGQVDPV